MNKKKILQCCFLYKTIIADIIYLKSRNRYLINKDIERYSKEYPYSKPGVLSLNYCLLFFKPFRNVFYYRTEQNHILRGISRFFLKPVTGIEIIGGEIGEGFRIDHNYCVIRVQKAGKNLTVRNGVTIGKGKRKENQTFIHPVIGDNVDIYANAVVFGGIHIGSNVNIGAGAVVNKDVPDCCTVVGNPMRIISNEGNHDK